MENIVIRERGVNYIQMAKNVVESYPQGIAHGLQKDAIQNAWDASIFKTPAHVKNKWKVVFSLQKLNGVQFLTIQDIGTCGLTGKMTSQDVADDTIPPEDERWARWEMLAAGKGDSSSLGERGQGKMLLIASSKNHEIYYESLREDGSYRMGWTQAKTTGCPLYMLEEQAARGKIAELGLEPIEDVGTRFIIVEPKTEIVDAVTDGSFVRFVEETWWPVILKYDASIQIDDGKKVHRVTVPEIFPIDGTVEDTKDYKSWVKNNLKMNFNRVGYRIKHIHLAYRDEGVGELLSGIGVFRGGMKITTLEFPSRSYRNKVYGYVEFDGDLDKKVKELEFPNHYQFRNEGIWRKTKDVIEQELEAFGQQKLGLGIDARTKENQKRTAAQTKAMTVLRDITKDWPFANTAASGGGGGEGGGTKPIKTIGLRLNNLAFPNEGNTPRLNYGDQLSSFTVTVFNRSNEKVHLQYAANVLSGDRTVIGLDEQNIILDKKSDVIVQDEYSFHVTKDLFPEPGIYRMKFTLRNSLSQKKDLEDEITRRFWVESDPDLGGPFDTKFIDFSEIPDSPAPVKAEWYLHPQGSGRWTLYVNSGHPSYLDNEAETKQTRYLSEVYCVAALKLLFGQVASGAIDLESEAQNLPFNPENILSDDPKEVYQELAWAISAIRYGIDKGI